MVHFGYLEKGNYSLHLIISEDSTAEQKEKHITGIQ